MTSTKPPPKPPATFPAARPVGTTPVQVRDAGSAASGPPEGPATKGGQPTEAASRGTLPALQVPACACPTDGVIDLLGKKWTLCLVATVANHGTLRFNRLQAELPSISPKTLSDTLQALQQHGVLDRVAYAEVPPRVEYTLTAAGRELVQAIQPLMGWAARHGQSSVCCS